MVFEGLRLLTVTCSVNLCKENPAKVKGNQASPSCEWLVNAWNSWNIGSHWASLSVGENFTLQVATPKLEKSWGTHARTGARPWGNGNRDSKLAPRISFKTAKTRSLVHHIVLIVLSKENFLIKKTPWKIFYIVWLDQYLPKPIAKWPQTAKQIQSEWRFSCSTANARPGGTCMLVQKPQSVRQWLKLPSASDEIATKCWLYLKTLIYHLERIWLWANQYGWVTCSGDLGQPLCSIGHGLIVRRPQIAARLPKLKLLNSESNHFGRAKMRY